MTHTRHSIVSRLAPSIGLIAMIFANSCGVEETSPTPWLLEADSTHQVRVPLGNIRAVRSHFVSRWFGLPADSAVNGQDSTANSRTPPTVLGDTRDAWILTSPGRIEVDLPAGQALRFRTSLRPETPLPRGMQVRGEVFLREGEQLTSLHSEIFGGNDEASFAWRPIQVDVSPSESATLEFIVRWNDPQRASQPGPEMAWANPWIGTQDSASNSSPDVLLVTVDTLRSDTFLANELLMAALGDCAIWPQAIAPSNWTLPAYGSLMTGQLPHLHGAGRGAFPEQAGLPAERSFRGLHPDLETLAEVFRNAGYATGMIHQNPFLEPWTGVDQGFRTYSRVDSPTPTALDQASRWWANHEDSPRFLVVHLMEPHLPYHGVDSSQEDPLSPLDWRAFFSMDHTPEQRIEFFNQSPEWKQTVKTAYQENVQEMSANLAPWLVNKLKDPNVVFGFHVDHGEELWDDGSFEHGHSFADSIVRVPLAIRAPGWEPGIQSTWVGSHFLGGSLLDAAQVAHNWPVNLHSTSEVRASSPLYRAKNSGRVFSLNEQSV
ncbi:MAG: sulfatase-like hydrolase/transferase, partial [Planctomycetes bacterium]|nr:sulfatase-like hydrolase/transferase [Planctomycetota bacterium]